MSCRAGVVGAGAVGRAVVGALIATATAHELILVSHTGYTAEALAHEATDMATVTGAKVRSRTVPYVGDLRDCDVVVIAARAAFTTAPAGPAQRLGGLHANAPLLHEFGAALRGYPGTVLVVTNPVDIMVRLFAEASGIEASFGIGSNLDSARYRAILADLHGVDVKDIDGHVVGEHGATMTLLASTTTIRGNPVLVSVAPLRDAVLSRSPRISTALGRTSVGPAGAVLSTLRRALGHDDGIEELSARGADGVFYGQLIDFQRGRPSVVSVAMTPSEAGDLAASTAHLEEMYHNVIHGTVSIR